MIDTQKSNEEKTISLFDSAIIRLLQFIEFGMLLSQFIMCILGFVLVVAQIYHYLKMGTWVSLSAVSYGELSPLNWAGLYKIVDYLNLGLVIFGISFVLSAWTGSLMIASELISKKKSALDTEKPLVTFFVWYLVVMNTIYSLKSFHLVYKSLYPFWD